MILIKPVSLGKKDNLVTNRFLKIFEKKLDIQSDVKGRGYEYYHFIDRLCRSLSLTSLIDNRRLTLDTRGKKFLFLPPERGFEVLFFGWLYYYPLYHFFPYGKFAEVMEEKCDEVFAFIKSLPPDEALDIDETISDFIKTLNISWVQGEIAGEKDEMSNSTEGVIHEKILSWGMRHTVLKPLAWFEFLGFHDLNMDFSDIINAKYIVIKPDCISFLNEKSGIVI